MRTTYRTTALELMMDIMPAIKELVDDIRKHDKNLAEQIQRASTSVVLNLAEADGVTKGHQRNRLETAYGSNHETRKGLRLGAIWKYVSTERVDFVDAHLDRVAAMTWRRLHGR